MTDIAALKILSSQIESFQKLPDPPDSLSDAAFDNYKASLEQSIDKAVESVQDVSAYVENITKKLGELKKCLPEQVKRIQDAIKALFGRFVVVPRKEDEKRQRRDEKERIKREEEERLRREAGERERERQKKHDEEKLKRERKRQRQEAEARERERGEERRKRNGLRERIQTIGNQLCNYNRPCDEVGGKKAFHAGVCCMVAAPPGDIAREDVDCYASDELDDVIEILDDGEKPASSIINIESKKGLVKSECPSRVYIPHCPVNSSSDELILKVSINGNDWETAGVVSPTQTMSENKKNIPVSNLVGIELSEFETIKIMVIARPRGQTVIVDKSGLNFITDKNVKLFMPRDAFPSRTEVRLVVNPISPETIAQNAKDDNLWENVMSTSSMISISCQRAPTKDIEIDIAHQTPATGERSSRGKMYHMLTTRDKIWKFADMEYKGTKDVVSVTLPSYKDRFSLFELEMPANIPKETALKVAQSCHEQIFKTPVRMVVRQHDFDPQKALVIVAGSKHVRSFIDQLRNDGYSYGPDVTKQFGLRDGQKFILTCAGNIATSSGKKGMVKMIYYTYMNLIQEPLQLHVVDMYKQRDLQEYRGIVRLTVDNGTEFPGEHFDLTVTLLKIERQKTIFHGKRVRFPYYLTTLAGFLSRQVCEHDEHSWKDVLLSIVGNKRELESLVRVAKRKVEDDNDVTSVCKVTLCDWMKATSKNDDKVHHILVALDCDGFHELHNKCSAFVQFQKEVMTDTALSEISSTTSKSANVLAADLNLKKEAVDRCKKEYGQDSLVLHLLYEWRESEEAIKYGNRALDRLRTLCGV